MDQKVIYISVSKLDEYRQFLDGVPYLPETFEELVSKKWLTKSKSDFKQKYGEAFHAWIEAGGPEGDFQYFANKKSDSNGNKIELTGEEVFIPSIELREVRKWVRETHQFRKPEVKVPGLSIELGPYRFIITGRIDSDLDVAVEDHKLSIGKPPSKYFDNYAASMAWRFYLVMTGKAVFFYNIFFRKDGVDAWRSDESGRSIMVSTPMIELRDQIKFFAYPDMKEECRVFAHELFSRLISTGFASKLWERQQRTSAAFALMPEEVIELKPRISPKGMSKSDLRSAETYYLTGAKGEAVKSVAITDDGKVLLPSADPSDHSLLYESLSMEIEESAELISQLAGDQTLNVLEGVFRPERDRKLIEGKIGDFKDREGNVSKVLVLKVDEKGIEMSYDSGDIFTLIPKFRYTRGELDDFYRFAFPNGEDLSIDKNYDPEGFLDEESEVLIDSPEATFDLKIIKKALLQYLDKPGLISYDGGKTNGTLRKVNKRGPQIRIEIEPAEEGEVDYKETFLISKMFERSQDFLTASNFVINTLPF